MYVAQKKNLNVRNILFQNPSRYRSRGEAASAEKLKPKVLASRGMRLLEWEERVVNFVIRCVSRAPRRCSLRFTGPNFSSLTR